MLDVGSAVALSQVAHQHDFSFGASGEVGMARFGGGGDPPAADPMQHPFAKSRSSRNHRDIAVLVSDAGLKNVDLGRLERRNRVRHRLEIVQQPDLRKLELRCHFSGVYPPRNVREVSRFVDHRTGDAEAGEVDRFSVDGRVAEKLFKNVRKRTVVERAVRSRHSPARA